MSAPDVHVTIAVFKGGPPDFQKFRLTALWFRFSDGSPSLFIHVIGPPQEFELEIRDDYDPSRSLKFAKAAPVGYLRRAMPRDQLETLLRNMRPDNDNREFNCQTWIGDVLLRLKSWNLLSGED